MEPSFVVRMMLDDGNEAFLMVGEAFVEVVAGNAGGGHVVHVRAGGRIGEEGDERRVRAEEDGAAGRMFRECEHAAVDLFLREFRRNTVERFVFGLAEGEACQDERRLADVREADFAVADGRLAEVRINFRDVFFLRMDACHGGEKSDCEFFEHCFKLLYLFS